MRMWGDTDTPQVGGEIDTIILESDLSIFSKTADVQMA